jgi:hypothetical protein
MALHGPIGERFRRIPKVAGGVLTVHATIRMDEDTLRISLDFHGLFPCSIGFFGQHTERRARHVLKLNT